MSHQLDERAIADHRSAVGKTHLCNFIVGFVGDNQIEVYLDPPARVRVEPMKPNQGILHYNDTHLDPYWDVRPVNPIDQRIADLRSMWTYGPSYNLSTGNRDGTNSIWPMNRLQRLLAWLPNPFRKR